jgi:hypothetical protein
VQRHRGAADHPPAIPRLASRFGDEAERGRERRIEDVSATASARPERCRRI